MEKTLDSKVIGKRAAVIEAQFVGEADRVTYYVEIGMHMGFRSEPQRIEIEVFSEEEFNAISVGQTASVSVEIGSDS